MLDLTDSLTYGFKIQATNLIGISEMSNTQYFVCADVPAAPASPPVLEEATETSITFSWSAPADNGGSPVTGYKAYMNALDDGDWWLAYYGSNQPTILVHE